MNTPRYRISQTYIHVQLGDCTHGDYVYLEVDRFTGVVTNTNSPGWNAEFDTLLALARAVQDKDREAGYPYVD